MFVADAGVLGATIVTSIAFGIGVATCDILYISIIVLCRFRLAAAVLIVDPVCIVVCRSFDGGDGIFGLVVCDDGVNLMLFLIDGGYSGGAFFFRAVVFGGGSVVSGFRRIYRVCFLLLPL